MPLLSDHPQGDISTPFQLSTTVKQAAGEPALKHKCEDVRKPELLFNGP
jgi:hypothetical protein